MLKGASFQLAPSTFFRVYPQLLDSNKHHLVQKAFKASIPILFGYIGAGFAFGLLAKKYEVSTEQTFLMSLIIYAGGMQYIALELFKQHISLGSLFVMSIFMNIRHIAYGIAMLPRYRNIPFFKKIYLIFGLTDETFAVLQGHEDDALSRPQKATFFLLVTLFNQLYWITGSMLGRILGSYINFSLEGAEFALVALFMIIFIDQWKASKSHIPAFLGIGSAITILFIDHSSNMITYAIALFIVIIFLFKPQLQNNNNIFKEDFK